MRRTNTLKIENTIATDALHQDVWQVQGGRWTAEEQRVLDFLRGCSPELADDYVRWLPKARQTILQSLLSSMLREDVAGVASDWYDLRVFEQPYKLVLLQEDECLLVPYARCYAFRRLDIDGDVLHVRSDSLEAGLGEVRPLLHPSELLQLVREKAQRTGKAAEGDWLRLADELRNGSANLALAYVHHARQKAAWRAQAHAHGTETTVAWILARLQGEERDSDFDPSLFFEQLCVEGHNLHPGAKTKMGMEAADVWRYAPEFGGRTELRVVGMRRDHAEFAAVGGEAAVDANRVLFAEYPELERVVRQEWAAHGLDVERYLFVPVHPWQLQHVLFDLYADEIAAGIVVPVEHVSIPAGATSSFRTVVPLGRGGQALALKVAVHSQMTSTVRSISANTTQNGPRFTEMVRAVLEREPELAATFVPVCEVAGYCYRASGDSSRQKLQSRNLSAVLRENIESFRQPGELAIVGTALYAESPVSGRTILAELIELYAHKFGAGTLPEAARRWVIEYAELALPGFLTLMVKYGIGLEGHLQNSVPVFRDGRPVRMLFRDWGGARLYRPRVQAQGCQPEFYPGSVIVTENLSDMQNKVFYTVYQNHLAEIILQACRAFRLPERDLWREVRGISDDVFARLAQDAALQEAVESDRAALYWPQIDHKALTKMRLQREVKGYCYAKVANPLHK